MAQEIALLLRANALFESWLPFWEKFYACSMPQLVHIKVTQQNRLGRWRWKRHEILRAQVTSIELEDRDGRPDIAIQCTHESGSDPGWYTKPSGFARRPQFYDPRYRGPDGGHQSL